MLRLRIWPGSSRAKARGGAHPRALVTFHLKFHPTAAKPKITRRSSVPSKAHQSASISMAHNEMDLEMEPCNQSTSHLERQMSVPEASITLKWSKLTAVAPASSPSWRQRLCNRTQDTPAKQDKLILSDGMDAFN